MKWATAASSLEFDKINKPYKKRLFCCLTTNIDSFFLTFILQKKWDDPLIGSRRECNDQGM